MYPPRFLIFHLSYSWNSWFHSPRIYFQSWDFSSSRWRRFCKSRKPWVCREIALPWLSSEPSRRWETFSRRAWGGTSWNTWKMERLCPGKSLIRSVWKELSPTVGPLTMQSIGRLLIIRLRLRFAVRCCKSPKWSNRNILKRCFWRSLRSEQIPAGKVALKCTIVR